MRGTFSTIFLFFILAWGIGCSLLKPLTPQQQYEYAKHYQAEGDYTQADRFLTKAIEKIPDYYDALILRAEVNRQRDSLNRTIADYTTLLDIKTLKAEQRAQILTLRGSAYYSNVQDALACKDWDNACENFGYTSACTSKRKYCK